MAVYALGDLHLSHCRPKPMAVFGPGWDNHPAKISANWNRVVGDSDLVIIAGDISWAMRLEEAVPDLEWLASLRGEKVLVRGNHDYWWSAIGKVRAALPRGLYALQNDHLSWGRWSICGSRGWLCPGADGFETAADETIYLRELQRLELSLQSAVQAGSKEIIAALHFPPYPRQGPPSGFTALLEKYGVKHCVFGHIHDAGREATFQGENGGVAYHFTAADGVDFTPVLVESD